MNEGLVLRFTIPLRPVTGNMARRTMAFLDKGRPVARTYLTKEAVEFRAWCAAFAQEAVEAIGWQISDSVCANVTLFCVNQDRGNAVKESDDSLEGLVYRRDSAILDGRIQKKWDDTNAPRLEYKITEVARADFDLRAKKRRRIEMPTLPIETSQGRCGGKLA